MTESLIDVQRHRYNQACKYQTELKDIIDGYTLNVKKIADAWLLLT